MTDDVLQTPTVVSPPDQEILTAAKGSGITFLGTMIEYAGRFILGFLLARFMGDEQYGLYSLADSAVYLMIGIAPLGLGTAVTYFIPIFASQRDDVSIWKTLQISLILPLAVSLLSGIGFLAFADPIATNVFHEPRLALLLRIAAIAIPAGTLATVAVSATQGFKQMKYKVIGQDILLTGTKLILTAVLVITGLNAIKAITVYSVGMVISCIALLYFLNRLFPLARPLNLDVRHTRQMFKFSLPVYLASLLTIFGPNIRTLLLGSLNTIRAVGVFTVASRVNLVGAVFLSSIGMMSMPIVSELYASKAWGKLKRFYQTMTKWAFTFNLLFFLAILLFARPILSIFGSSYVSGDVCLIILACSNLIDAATGICAVMVVMTGNVWLNMLNSVIRLVSTLGLSIWLIPEYGVVGAATATATSFIIINIIITVEVYILLRLSPYDKTYAKPVIAGLLSAAVAYMTRQWVFKGESLIGTLIGMSVLVIVYIAALLLLGLSVEDQMVLKRISGRLSQIPVLTRIIR